MAEREEFWSFIADRVDRGGFWRLFDATAARYNPELFEKWSNA